MFEAFLHQIKYFKYFNLVQRKFYKLCMEVLYFLIWIVPLFVGAEQFRTG